MTKAKQAGQTVTITESAHDPCVLRINGKVVISAPVGEPFNASKAQITAMKKHGIKFTKAEAK